MVTSNYTAKNWSASRVWSLCKSVPFREAAPPLLLVLMLFGGSWKTAPVFGEPDSWFPTLAVMLPLIALTIREALHRIRHRERSLPGGLIVLAMFTLWLAIRSFWDGSFDPTGIVKSARFAFLPLSLAVAGALLMRSVRSVERFTTASAAIGGILVVAALFSNLFAPQDHYGLSSFRENSVVFGWTASYTLLALLALTSGALRRRSSMLGGSATGAALVAVLLNGAKASALAVLLAVIIASPLLFASWRSRPDWLARARWAAAGFVLGAILAVASFVIHAEAGFRFIDEQKAQQTVSNSVFGRAAHASSGMSMSTNIRQLAWLAAVRDFGSSPLLGHGTGSFHIEGVISKNKWAVDYPHNIVLETAAETGMIGLVLLLVTFVAGLKATRSASLIDTRSAGSFFLLAGFVFSVAVAQFSGDLQMNRGIWIFAGIAWGLATHTGSRIRQKAET